MKFAITHLTDYTFSSPVWLKPHFLCIYPISVPHQTVTSHRLTLSPTPAGMKWILDPEGNRVCHLWFTGTTQLLRIYSELSIETQPMDPLDFVYYPLESAQAAHIYPSPPTPPLACALMPIELPLPLLDQLQTLQAQFSDTTALVTAINQWISATFGFESRYSGAPWTPAETWERKQGSCRDLSWLAIAMYRRAGIAARFVSGYHYSPDLPEHDLHAWVEVYLPGGGWLALDPSSGLWADEAYVPLAASVDHSATMPVTGSFAGAAEAHLVASLRIERR